MSEASEEATARAEPEKCQCCGKERAPLVAVTAETHGTAGRLCRVCYMLEMRMSALPMR